jgi:hypothetical protein
MTFNWWKENADKKYLNQFYVVLVLWTEETVGQGLDAEPLCQNERTQPPELEKILKNFTPFSSLLSEKAFNHNCYRPYFNVLNGVFDKKNYVW